MKRIPADAKMVKMLKLLNLILLLVTLIACTQGSDFNSEVEKSQEFLTQTKACQEVDLYNSPLDQANTLNTFKCFKWDKKYKKLYKYIEQTNSLEWNLVVGPLNDIYFGSEQKREKFIQVTSSLKNDQGFENLHQFVQIFFKHKDFFNFLISVTKKDSNFREKLVQILSNKTLTTENVKPLLLSYKNFIKSLETNKKSFTPNFNKVNKEGKYIDKLIDVVDVISRYVSDEKFEKDIPILENITVLNDKAWLKNSFENEITLEKFKDLLNKPYVERPYIISDLKNVRRAYTETVKCTKIVDNLKFVFDVKHEVEEKIDDLTNENFDQFFLGMADAKTKILVFENFCDATIDNENILPSMYSLHKEVEEIIVDPAKLNFLSKMHQAFLNDTGAEKIKFINFVTGEFSTLTIEFLTLINDKNPKFLDELYYLIKGLDESFYVELHQFFKGFKDSQDIELLKIMSQVWNDFKFEEKQLLMNLLRYQFNDNYDFHKIIKHYLKFIYLNDDFDSIFHSKYFSSETTSTFVLDIINKHLTAMVDQNILDELSRFLSKDSLLRLFELYSKGVAIEPESDEDEEFDEKDNYVLTKEISTCLEDLNQSISANVDYYDLIYTLPKSCRNTNSNFMVLDVTTMLKEVNDEFRETYSQDLIATTGILSPEMMKDILLLIIKTNILLEEQGYYQAKPSEIVEGLRKYLFKDKNINVFDSLIRLLNNVQSKNIDLLNTFAKDLLSTIIVDSEDAKLIPEIFSNFPSNISYPSSGKCEDFQFGNIDAENCVSKKQLKIALDEIIGTLSNKTDAKKQTLESVIDLFDKRKGFLVPSNKKYQEPHIVTISSLSNLLIELSDEKTNTKLTYEKKDSAAEIELSTLGMIDVVIKDISFLNNFYGAFFINKVGAAKDYTKKVKVLKKNVNLLESFGGMFRGLKVFPKETKWLLKNIKNTYQGLIDAGLAGHGEDLRAVLALLSSTSPERSQSFMAFKKPNQKQVEGHKSKLLTELSKIRGLLHLSELVKKNYSKGGKLEKDFIFNYLDKNFLQVFTNAKIKEVFRKLVGDVYTKGSTMSQFKNMLVDYLFRLDEHKRSEVASLVWKFLYLSHASFDNVKNDGISQADKILDLVPSLLEFIVEYGKRTQLSNSDVDEFVSGINKLLMNFSTNLKGNKRKLSRDFLLMLTKTSNGETIFNVLTKIVKEKNGTELVDKTLLQAKNLFSNLDDKDLNKIMVILSELMEGKYLNKKDLIQWVNENTKESEMAFFNYLIEYLARPSQSNPDKTKLLKMLEVLIEDKPERLKKFLDEIHQAVVIES